MESPVRASFTDPLAVNPCAIISPDAISSIPRRKFLK
jgi:hypothetical protein